MSEKLLKMELDYSNEVSKWITDIKSNENVNEAIDKLYICEKLTRLVRILIYYWYFLIKCLGF